MSKQDEFMDAIHVYIDYWNTQDEKTTKEKLSGLAFSILVMLDGMSGQFDGTIEDLVNFEDELLHDKFYKKTNDRG